MLRNFVQSIHFQDSNLPLNSPNTGPKVGKTQTRSFKLFKNCCSEKIIKFFFNFSKGNLPEHTCWQVNKKKVYKIKFIFEELRGFGINF